MFFPLTEASTCCSALRTEERPQPKNHQHRPFESWLLSGFGECKSVLRAGVWLWVVGIELYEYHIHYTIWTRVLRPANISSWGMISGLPIRCTMAQQWHEAPPNLRLGSTCTLIPYPIVAHLLLGSGSHLLGSASFLLGGPVIRRPFFLAPFFWHRFFFGALLF